MSQIQVTINKLTDNKDAFHEAHVGERGSGFVGYGTTVCGSLEDLARALRLNGVYDADELSQRPRP